MHMGLKLYGYEFNDIRFVQNNFSKQFSTLYIMTAQKTVNFLLKQHPIN